MNDFLNLQFIVLFAILDVLLFTRRDNNHWFFKLLFSSIAFKGKKLYYIYRPLQFILFAIGFYLLLPLSYTGFWAYLYSLIPLIAYILAYVLYVTDLLYHLFGLELEELFAYEKVGEKTYWLEHFYQIGHYTWKEFSLKQFLFFSITSIIILLISNII